MKKLMYLLIVGAMFVFTACNWISPGDKTECAVEERQITDHNFPRCQVERGQCLTDHSCCMDTRGYDAEAAPANYDAYEDVMDEYEDVYEEAMDEYEDVYEEAMDEYEDAYEDAMDEYEDLLEDAYDAYDDY